MHEDDLRAMIRDAIARHLGAGSLGAEAMAKASPSPAPMWKSHLSHGRFVFLAPTEPDAPCVVEPQVRCHHCGFCQSYGH
jgi:hypothetical protein